MSGLTRHRFNHGIRILQEIIGGRARGVVERVIASDTKANESDLALFARVLRQLENTELRRGGTAILICAAPKSASTFLLQAMSGAFGLSIANYSHVETDAEGNETLLDQQLSFSSVLFRKYVVGDSISQLHVPASKHNINIIKNLGIRCIVTERNIFDSAVSLRDNFVNTTNAKTVENKKNLYAPGQGVFFRMPPFNERRKARLGTEAEQYDFIIDHLMPWYFQFYGTWLWAERQAGVELARVDYDEVTGDPVNTLKRLGDFIGCHHGQAALDKQLAALKADKEKANYNVGRPGRGKELLTREQQDRLVQIGCQYMDYDDFSHLL